MADSVAPTSRSVGDVLVVGSQACRAAAGAWLVRMGYRCHEADNPYTAMLELAQRPLVYRAMVLSVSSLHEHEDAIVGAVRRRFPHVDVWLAQAESRDRLTERLRAAGASAVLSEDGLERGPSGRSQAGGPAGAPRRAAASPADAEAGAAVMEMPVAPVADTEQKPAQERPAARNPGKDAEAMAVFGPEPADEPLLTPEELRALLQEPEPEER